MSSFIVFWVGFLGMEWVAWFSHKYIMHGFLWILHEDHHTKHNRFFEKNDFFFILYATPGFLLILFGANAGYDYRFFSGAGIAAYGFTYAFMHDIVIHQRLKWFTRWRNPYIQAVRRAHAAHHKNRGKAGCVSFGMLVFHPKYLHLIKK